MKYQIKNIKSGVIVMSSTVQRYLQLNVKEIFSGMIQDGVQVKEISDLQYIINQSGEPLEVWNNIKRFPNYQISDCGDFVRNKVTRRVLKRNINRQVKLADEKGIQVWIVTNHLLSEL